MAWAPPTDRLRLAPPGPGQLISKAADRPLQLAPEPVDSNREVEDIGVAKGGIAGHGALQQRASFGHAAQ